MLDLALNQISRTTLLATVFVAVLLLVMVVGNLMGSRHAVRRRLKEAGKAGSEATTISLRAGDTSNAWTALVQGIERRGLSLVDTNADRLRSRLIAAGYESTAAPKLYTLIRLVLTLGMPATLVLVEMSAREPPSVLKLYLFGAFLALMGLYLPNLWVAAKAARRQQELLNGFPDALDLMLVCVEAGLGLEAAFDRVGREMAVSHPLVSKLFGAIVLELRAGRSREDALRRMGDAAAIDEIRSFATLLIQSDKLGSSIGQTLRIYAAEMREKRRLRAEEKAHRLPVLLSIPLVACMLPVMIGVLMLPAVIRVIRDLMPALAG